jgi:hypothetical protein
MTAISTIEIQKPSRRRNHVISYREIDSIKIHGDQKQNDLDRRITKCESKLEMLKEQKKTELDILSNKLNAYNLEKVGMFNLTLFNLTPVSSAKLNHLIECKCGTILIYRNRIDHYNSKKHKTHLENSPEYKLRYKI